MYIDINMDEYAVQLVPLAAGTSFSISMPSTHCAMRTLPLLPGPCTEKRIKESQLINQIQNEGRIAKRQIDEIKFKYLRSSGR